MNNTSQVTVVALGSGCDFIKTYENLKGYLKRIDDIKIKNVYMEELTLGEVLRSHEDTLNWDLSFKFDSFREAAVFIEKMIHDIPEKFIRIAAITQRGYLSISDIHGDGLLDRLPGKTSEEIVRRIIKSFELDSRI